MTMRDIIRKFASGEITYAQAKSEAKQIVADEDAKEDLYLTIDKIAECYRESRPTKTAMDSDDDLNHNMPLLLGFVPNECYEQILFETVQAIQAGEFADGVSVDLIESWGISPVLAAYFFSEAERRVRLKTLTSEEFDLVGEQWVAIQEEKIRQKITKMLQYAPVVRKTDE